MRPGESVPLGPSHPTLAPWRTAPLLPGSSPVEVMFELTLRLLFSSMWLHGRYYFFHHHLLVVPYRLSEQKVRKVRKISDDEHVTYCKLDHKQISV